MCVVPCWRSCGKQQDRSGETRWTLRSPTPSPAQPDRALAALKADGLVQPGKAGCWSLPQSGIATCARSGGRRRLSSVPATRAHRPFSA